MDLVADILLGAGALGAGLYCHILALRLKRFATLETGMGGAIAVLSAQVDDLTQALERSRAAAGGSTARLDALTLRAEEAANKLELLVASMHDLPAGPLSQGPVDAADRRLRVLRRRPLREDGGAAS